LDLRPVLSCSNLHTQPTKHRLEMHRFGSGSSSLVLDKLDLPRTKEGNSSWLEKCEICEELIGGGRKWWWLTDGAWMQHLKGLVV
jgi:hypothetical protein